MFENLEKISEYTLEKYILSGCSNFDIQIKIVAAVFIMIILGV